MASGLRAKLQAIAPGNAAKAAMPERGGLVVRTDRRKAPEGLLSLPKRGLERLGAGEGFSVEKCLFLDTETTGLSGGAGTAGLSSSARPGSKGTNSSPSNTYCATTATNRRCFCALEN